MLTSLQPLAESLCATCDEASTCGYRLRSTEPVLFCEDFQLAPAPPRAREFPARTQVVPEPTQPATRSRWALCQNCDLRQSCRLPEPESGVWHCEEYR